MQELGGGAHGGALGGVRGATVVVGVGVAGLAGVVEAVATAAAKSGLNIYSQWLR